MLRVAVVVKNDYIGQSHSVHNMKGPGQLCAGEEGARAALCAGGRGQSHSVCEMKGPGQLCAGDEGARAAL